MIIMYDELKEKAALLPMDSGVYIMEDSSSNIIYIGKAKHLKNRVSSYFNNLSSHTEKTLQMVARVDHFRVMVTHTEFDALLLESQLIKQHKPKYNILLKDDKGFPFVRLESGEYKAFQVVGKKQRDKARYFGPYISRGNAHAAIDLALNLVKLPQCSRVFPRDFGRERPCLNFHMEKCLGFCTGQIPKDKFCALQAEACLVLEGKYQGLEARLTSEMEDAAQSLEYERAANIRDKLAVVKRLGTGQGVFSKSLVDTDVLAYQSLNMRGVVVKLSYIAGTMLNKETLFFEGSDSSDGAEVLESFIKQYYDAVGVAPKNILLSQPIEDMASLSQFVSGVGGRAVTISVPQKGEKYAQILVACENARRELEMQEKLTERSLKSLEQLGQVLNIKPPKRIESYDISHTGGADTVGGMVVFVDGKPQKGDYKRFKISPDIVGDDYAAMSQVLGRRLERAENGDPGFLPLPDLILIDGGQGQVAVAAAQLEQHSLTLPCFGMVKDDRHRTRGLVDKHGASIGIDTLPPLFAFITRVQDEVHRFAIDYHKKLRGGKMTHSVLDDIKSVGPRSKEKLYKHFKTVTAIKAASFNELCQVVPKNTAQSIIEYFGGKEEK